MFKKVVFLFALSMLVGGPLVADDADEENPCIKEPLPKDPIVIRTFRTFEVPRGTRDPNSAINNKISDFKKKKREQLRDQYCNDVCDCDDGTDDGTEGECVFKAEESMGSASTSNGRQTTFTFTNGTCKCTPIQWDQPLIPPSQPPQPDNPTPATPPLLSQLSRRIQIQDHLRHIEQYV